MGWPFSMMKMFSRFDAAIDGQAPMLHEHAELAVHRDEVTAAWSG